MTARVEVTPEDARLLRVLATLVECLPEQKRAGHLRGKADELAARMERALAGAAP